MISPFLEAERDTILSRKTWANLFFFVVWVGGMLLGLETDTFVYSRTRLELLLFGWLLEIDFSAIGYIVLPVDFLLIAYGIVY